jgi:hypothetical protein
MLINYGPVIYTHDRLKMQLILQIDVNDVKNCMFKTKKIIPCRGEPQLAQPVGKSLLWTVRFCSPSSESQI